MASRCPSADDLDAAMDGADGKFEVVVWDARTGRKSTIDGNLDPAAPQPNETAAIRRFNSSTAVAPPPVRLEERRIITRANDNSPANHWPGCFLLIAVMYRLVSVLAEVERRRRASPDRFERKLLRGIQGTDRIRLRRRTPARAGRRRNHAGAHETIVDLFQIIAIVVERAVGILAGPQAEMRSTKRCVSFASRTRWQTSHV